MNVNFVIQYLGVGFRVEIKDKSNLAVTGVPFAELVNRINFYHVKGILPVNVDFGIEID